MSPERFVMLTEAQLRAILDETVARTAATYDRPRWRTADAEAKIRGFATPRAFRDWCKRYGVPLRGEGKHVAVDVSEVDAAFDRVALARATMDVADDDAAEARRAVARDTADWHARRGPYARRDKR